jgi:hypothetical protein
MKYVNIKLITNKLNSAAAYSLKIPKKSNSLKPKSEKTFIVGLKISTPIFTHCVSKG